MAAADRGRISRNHPPSNVLRPDGVRAWRFSSEHKNFFTNIAAGIKLYLYRNNNDHES
jgi:hypothetical protein